MDTLTGFISSSDSGMVSHMMPILSTMVEEIGEELSDKDEATMQLFIAQIGMVIAWVGHGDNSKLPENLRMFAEAIQPDTNTSERRGEPAREPAMGDTRALASAPQA